VQLLGGTGEMAMPGDGLEIAELADLDQFILDDDQRYRTFMLLR
jgi:hypothetical protein